MDVTVGQILRARGFEVLVTHEAGQKGARDDEQLDFASTQECALPTHNRADFEALARECAAAGRSHAGIIIAVRRPAREIARRLLVLLDQVTADEMRNQVRYI